MVDTLVSGASASRHVGSSPIIRTIKKVHRLMDLFFVQISCYIYADEILISKL